MWQITVQSARVTTVVDVSGSMADEVPGSDGKTRLDVTKESLQQALGQFSDQERSILTNVLAVEPYVPVQRPNDAVNAGK